MVDYSGFGNEVLAPLAYGGDQDATDELERRGNQVVASRKVLKKTVTGATLIGGGFTMWNDNRIKPGDVCLIENGKVVSVNGER